MKPKNTIILIALLAALVGIVIISGCIGSDENVGIEESEEFEEDVEPVVPESSVEPAPKCDFNPSSMMGTTMKHCYEMTDKDEKDECCALVLVELAQDCCPTEKDADGCFSRASSSIAMFYKSQKDKAKALCGEIKDSKKKEMCMFSCCGGSVETESAGGAEPPQTIEEPETKEPSSSSAEHTCGTITPDGMLALDPRICMSKPTKAEQDECAVYCQIESIKMMCENPTHRSGMTKDECYAGGVTLAVQYPSQKDKVLELCNMMSDPAMKQDCKTAVNEMTN